MSPPNEQADRLRQRHRRQSSSSSKDALIAAVKTLEHKAERTLLLLWDDLPAWRRDNAFIHSGYRQIRASYSHAFRSLFYLHNESVNIWSHLVGALLAMTSATYLYYEIQPRYASASSSDVLVFSCFFGGAVLCLGMSATYHAIQDHSPSVARWGNKLDYTGIVALIVGSYVPAMYYGFFCKPTLLTVYLGLVGPPSPPFPMPNLLTWRDAQICILGLGCTMVSWLDRFRTPLWRPYRAAMFIGLGVSGVVPILQGLTIYGYRGLEDRMGITWVIAQGVMYIAGAVIYAVRWPERSFPGAFDIWGSSHQIFHLFVVLAAAMHLFGMAKGFDYHHTVMGSQCLAV
ncbi:hemolysin-iii channel protein [Drechmeria coniospora]|uniref:Hemolysin-iii channel protein n=1 Tax=Drechmeria coniospora TaxID=98403 RepID=A0A151GBN6_DRECN|nr:hemolysin-iii channel protein [Drechmeria coniospora]KYK54461.1 hemolysin-iii channel protein [Drechmeria coniospora]ODA77259.1 hypothetical protein RJ55_06886 [Drechmeria coniospora]